MPASPPIALPPADPRAPADAPLLVVFGAGGHGRVAADAALASRAWRGVVACDRREQLWGSELLDGVPVLSPRALGDLPVPWQLHVAIGDNASRRREAQTLLAGQAGGTVLATIVHPQAALSPSAVIGPGCLLTAHCVVAALAVLGEGVIVNHTAVVDHDCAIGAWAHIAPGARLGGAVRVGDGALVGSGSTVMRGLRVGSGSVLGAGAVALQDIPDEGRWAGVPARQTHDGVAA